jgi:2-keto-3-deoxy-galactonokinase
MFGSNKGIVSAPLLIVVANTAATAKIASNIDAMENRIEVVPDFAETFSVRNR